MSIIQGNSKTSAAGYTIDQSARFNDGDSPELSRTYTLSAPWTFSAWVKRCELGAVNILLGTSGSSPEIQFNSGDTITAEALTTTAVFRDPAAWYHIHVSDNGLYINGTSFGAVTTTSLTNAKLFDDFDGYVAEVHLQSGTSAYTNFGETNSNTGQWVPKAATAGDTYLKFANSSDFGENSGTGGAWTASGLTSADQVSDSPTDSFCTFNSVTGQAQTLSEGNLKSTISASQGVSLGTVAVTSGKWYWEVTNGNDNIGGSRKDIGIVDVANFVITSGQYFVDSAYGWGYVENGSKENNNSQSAYGNVFDTAGKIVGVALDLDNGAIWFSNDGTWQNSATVGEIEAGTTTNAAFTSLSGTFVPAYSDFSGNATANFGQSAFTYTPPTGFSALSTANLATPTIVDPSAYFQATTYTGNGTAIGSGGNAINQSGNSTFQPDMVWIKNRDAADNNMLYDAVRGATKDLHSNTTDAEATDTEGLSTFDADGFTVGSNVEVNTSTENYVGWQWKANGSGSSNTDGSITSTVSANTTAGFSIVTWTGTGAAGTVGHGLGVAPSLIIVKNRTTATTDWPVYHASNTAAPETDVMFLNSTAATADDATYWNDTAPTSSLFTVGTNDEANKSSDSMVAYCFAEVEGFSKFGKFVGNNNSNGPMIYMPFKPAYFLVKNINAANSWLIFDGTRNTYNVNGTWLQAESANAESTTSHAVDFLSNGVKVRSNASTALNGDTSTYIYAAFAESPFKTANAR